MSDETHAAMTRLYEAYEAIRHVREGLYKIGKGVSGEEAQAIARTLMNAYWAEPSTDPWDAYIYLNPYHAANLSWCLDAIMRGAAPHLNTGDWVGEIKQRVDRVNVGPHAIKPNVPRWEPAP